MVDLSRSSICAFYLSPVALFDEGQEGWQAENDLDGCLPANDQYTSAEVYNYGAVLDTGDKAIGTLRVNFTETPVDIGKSISSLIPSIGADDIEKASELDPGLISSNYITANWLEWQASPPTKAPGLFVRKVSSGSKRDSAGRSGCRIHRSR